ncbi:trehalose-6-phosphate synthase [Haladaptatus sp. GCM10025707]|uniref:alpha,alpha-trehalose-phosphate synthase (UDP-forming) n=1 Tax=unclassified Haladaptatus TaxID=2622732 RepID=UPI0023E756BC|nr:trehalose-6-phosphate synthase [Haladaptatus sp. QDMS2]
MSQRSVVNQTSAATDPTNAFSDVVVVSNRQPYRHSFDEDGETISVDRPCGGLTAGLDPVMQEIQGTWVAWGDGDADSASTDDDNCVRVPPDQPRYTLQRLSLSEFDVRGYYDGYSNQLLWPLCHSMAEKIDIDTGDWQTYREVNDKFADAVVTHAQPGGAIWFQDYHLTLVPRMVRNRLDEDVRLMHFFHIPWPAPDVFRACPHAERILDGLTGNDLLGFHTPRFAANFLECADRLLPEATVNWEENTVHTAQGTTTVTHASMGIDEESVRKQARAADGSFWADFRAEHSIDADVQVALGVDRLDYTKGIPKRLDALESLFEHRPDLREELTYVQKGTESRSRIPAYQNLQETVADAIERINDRFGTDDWQPVVETRAHLSREHLVSLYHHSDIGLVSSLRDGMNLVAKEYIAAQTDDDGVLVLSELAGASEELGEGALTVNPHDTGAMAATIEQAIELSKAERIARMRALREVVREENLESWIDGFFAEAASIE